MDFVYPDSEEWENLYSEVPQSIFPVRIETERLIFEAVPFSSLTLRDLYDLYNVEELTDIFDTIPIERHSTPRETKEFRENSRERFVNGEGICYIVHEKSDMECSKETAIGVTGGHIDWDLYEFSCYIWLLPEAQGNGYSKERGEMFLKLAFDELSLETVRVSVLESNTPSQKAIEGYVCKNGGQKEGIKRNGVMFGSGLRDVVKYSIVHEEWEESRRD
jgi:RimJ/RimL family protein N-acetyltransferase